MNYHSDTWIDTKVREHWKEALEHFKRENIVGIFLQGSQNYGLDTKNSDVDTKLIVTPSLNEIVKNCAPHSTTYVRKNNEHIDFKDIRLMLKTFKKQNINFIEILFTKYNIINYKYGDVWSELRQYREEIAHYNLYFTIKAMKGMAYEKYHALEHRYPAKVEIIDKYGYDGKQLSHMLRIKEFLERYINGELYENCLITKIPEYLKYVKRHELSLSEAREYADQTLKEVDSICEPFTKDSCYNVSDKEVEELLDWAQYEIIRRSLKYELRGQ